MSSYSRVINHATSILCSNKGSLSFQQLHRKVFQRVEITEDDFWYIVKKCSRFVVVRNRERTDEWGTDCVIVAKTSLRLCKNYTKQDCRDCQELHLCKYFVYGNCRFGKGRKQCKFSHDVRSEHNYTLLRECTLHELHEDDLFLLLLQNDPTLLPEVCSHYNKGSGPHGACTFRDGCTKMHMCMHFVQDDCMFGSKCKRQHVIDQHGLRMLEERGLSGDIIKDLPFVYQNLHRLNTPTTPYNAKEHVGELVSRPVIKKEDRKEICLHFIRRNCRFQGSRPVDFLTMTQESDPVRRLSTVSSVTKPAHYILTTEWLWYYKGDHENWIEFGRPDDKQRMTSLSSRELEEAYLADGSAEVTIMKGHRNYYLRFQDMYQRNPKHNTKRRVRRRPRFISIMEVENKTAP
uniref:Poly (ADP-ribose) polymerase family, member 12b n=1 Tax=Oncorhynchus tshawytscha TaxID=74940 RepID=A0AAZ3PZE8_ONCTS